MISSKAGRKKLTGNLIIVIQPVVVMKFEFENREKLN